MNDAAGLETRRLHLLDDLHRRFPANLTYTFSLAQSLHRMGELQIKLDDIEAAYAAQESSHGLLEQLHHQSPELASLRRTLGHRQGFFGHHLPATV